MFKKLTVFRRFLTGAVISFAAISLVFAFLSATSIGNSLRPDETSMLANDDSAHEACQGERELKEARTFGDYEAKIWIIDDWNCVLLEIEKMGQVVYRHGMIGGHFHFGIDWDQENEPLKSMIDYGSTPNLLISSWNGGAHCCFALHIFNLRDHLTKVADIYGAHSSPELEDLDHDGIPEIKVTDYFLAYRFSSFADSATADVILKYANGRYRVAAELMIKPAPDLNSLADEITSWQTTFQGHDYYGDAPESLIQKMTDLVFTGNKAAAFDLLDRSWPENIPGKREFLKAYEKELSDSMYYPEFEAQI